MWSTVVSSPLPSHAAAPQTPCRGAATAVVVPAEAAIEQLCVDADRIQHEWVELHVLLVLECHVAPHTGHIPPPHDASTPDVDPVAVTAAKAWRESEWSMHSPAENASSLPGVSHTSMLHVSLEAGHMRRLASKHVSFAPAGPLLRSKQRQPRLRVSAEVVYSDRAPRVRFAPELQAHSPQGGHAVEAAASVRWRVGSRVPAGGYGAIARQRVRRSADNLTVCNHGHGMMETRVRGWCQRRRASTTEHRVRTLVACGTWDPRGGARGVPGRAHESALASRLEARWRLLGSRHVHEHACSKHTRTRHAVHVATVERNPVSCHTGARVHVPK